MRKRSFFILAACLLFIAGNLRNGWTDYGEAYIGRKLMLQGHFYFRERKYFFFYDSKITGNSYNNYDTCPRQVSPTASPTFLYHINIRPVEINNAFNTNGTGQCRVLDVNLTCSIYVVENGNSRLIHSNSVAYWWR